MERSRIPSDHYKQVDKNPLESTPFKNHTRKKILSTESRVKKNIRDKSTYHKQIVIINELSKHQERTLTPNQVNQVREAWPKSMPQEFSEQGKALSTKKVLNLLLERYNNRNKSGREKQQGVSYIKNYFKYDQNPEQLTEEELIKLGFSINLLPTETKKDNPTIETIKNAVKQYDAKKRKNLKLSNARKIIENLPENTPREDIIKHIEKFKQELAPYFPEGITEENITIEAAIHAFKQEKSKRLSDAHRGNEVRQEPKKITPEDIETDAEPEPTEITIFTTNVRLAPICKKRRVLPTEKFNLPDFETLFK